MYTGSKRAKDYYDKGAIQIFSCTRQRAHTHGAVESSHTKLHSKWSNLNRIAALKGGLGTVEDPETEQSITVHVDSLAFCSPRFRDELEPSVSFDPPFRSSTVPSLHDLFGESPLEPSTVPAPTPIHAPTPTAGSLHFWITRGGRVSEVGDGTGTATMRISLCRLET